MKKISIIFGTRPEAVKLCPLVLYLQRTKQFQIEVCVTGQHREMLDQVLKFFAVTSDVDINVMTQNQTLAGLTSKIITAVDEYLSRSKPDLIIVQGDTSTVMAASLAALYNKIPIAHVEAGLRTGNLLSPWPEEANRIITGHLADIHFCPTESSKKNLLLENIPEKKIYVTGNTVIDALMDASRRLDDIDVRIPDLPEELQPGNDDPKVVLITGHRRENFGKSFENICNAIRKLAERFPDVHFLYPVHKNPQVRMPVQKILGSSSRNIHLIEPLSYHEFIAAMKRAYLILTDSGGVQEEAPSLGKPVLVMRDTTERPEAVSAGTVKLVGTDLEAIYSECELLLTNPDAYNRMSQKENPYGDGKACERIFNALTEYFYK